MRALRQHVESRLGRKRSRRICLPKKGGGGFGVFFKKAPARVLAAALTARGRNRSALGWGMVLAAQDPHLLKLLYDKQSPKAWV